MMMATRQFEIVSRGNITAVAFMDESQVVGGYFDGDIRRWRIEDGQQLGPTMQAGNSIRSVTVSKDRQWIVSGDQGEKAIVWSAATHKKECQFTGFEGSVTAVDISGDCTKVVGGSWGTTYTVQLFGTHSGTQLLPSLSHRGIRGVKFSPDGSRFATASYDSGFRVYSTHSGTVLFDSGRQTSSNAIELVTPLVWSPDGQQLFIASKGKITCFNVSDSSSSEWSIHETQSAVSIASNGRFIACSAGKSISLWDCVSHSQIGSIITHTTDIYCMALSPSGAYLACGTGKNITIYNLRDVLPSEYIVSGLPLIHVSRETLASWTEDDPTNTERLLSEEIARALRPSQYLLASRALIRVRLKHVALAIEDSKESLRIQPSPIGYIARAVALLTQGDREGALRIFDLAFHDCEPHDNRFLLLLKSILVFESGNQEDAIARVELLATRATDDNDVDATYLCAQVLGVMCVKKGNYAHATPWIERARELARKVTQCPPLKTISLIFGWSFTGLNTVAQQHLCETHYAEGRTVEAVKMLHIIKTSDGETQVNKATVDWIADFTKKCAVTLEDAGDEAFRSAKYDDAITQYSAALSLSPPSTAGLFIKRSKARVAKESWEDAVQDANEAVKADPSNPWGYKAKHAALHGAKQYDEAIDAFKSMLPVIEQSRDPAIRQLRRNCISPSDTIADIDTLVDKILQSSPLVVIDAQTGCLCDHAEQKRIFKDSPKFKELVSSMTSKLDSERIQQLVASFFGYVTFSHTWQGEEPSFQDVKRAKSVWKLPNTHLNEKLRRFCKETLRHGYNWAWSDTCCIDKDNSSILNQSLTSMFKWYADSAATIVYLADVAHPSMLGDLTRSYWMTRAWTLQELLAPKAIFFYDSGWNRYLDDTSTNHKKSPKIIQELTDAIKIAYGTIDTFSPDNLGVREKLRLASTRNAKFEEDIAYSLIGIFESDIKPHYGEGADAVGHLLEEIVARSGEVTVLAWSGKSSSYNSCLPASLSVYGQIPHNPPPLEGEELNTCITKLRGKLSEQEVLSICGRINSLPPARFATRRLHLPCIVFPVRGLSKQGLHRGKETLYQAEVSGLGNVGFMSAEDLQLDKQQKFVFVHPWINHLRGPSGGVPWEDELDPDAYTGLDGVVPSQAVPTPDPGRYVQALEMIARLGQPFNALLLAQQPNGRVYKRVAAESEIIVPGLGTNISSKCILAKVLEIL